MQNGYYLATYMQIDELANIYETAERHDQNASLWLKRGNNIELVHFWELERITGKKNTGWLLITSSRRKPCLTAC